MPLPASPWTASSLGHDFHHIIGLVSNAPPLTNKALVLISQRYKCIFVEVPKTGSTSIRHILGHPPKPHMNIHQISQEIDPHTFNSYFKFGFVRNPWDRAVSLYERREGIQMRDRMSFDEFVRWMKFASSTCIHPVPHRYQLDWFVNPSGDLQIDYIGRFETLDRDWDHIRTRLGIPDTLPNVNSRENKRDYREYYTPDLASIIRERFAVDIEYFRYSFDC